MATKRERYNLLVEQRKACRLCKGLSNPALRALRQFDSDEIGPWTRLHGDLNAKLMIVGQDWADVDYYLKHRGEDKLTNPTMENLEKILKHIGLDICITSYANPRRGLFLTNSILCLKRGGLQAKIDPAWVSNCGARFLYQQVEIVRPRVVVGMGKFAFHAILKAFDLKPVPLAEAIKDGEGAVLSRGIRLFAAYHCGKGTVNRNRSLSQQAKDWERIRQHL